MLPFLIAIIIILPDINARVDGSNKFGDRSNDKLLPIWSVSGAYNISEHDWMQYNWI